jgi:hypothetical protein
MERDPMSKPVMGKLTSPAEPAAPTAQVVKTGAATAAVGQLEFDVDLQPLQAHRRA